MSELLNKNSGTIQWMTRAQYARYRDVTPGAISHAIKAGRMTVSTDGKIDPEIADLQLDRTTRNSSDSNAFLRARTKRLQCQAQMLKIRYELAAGILLDKEAAREAIEDVGSALVQDLDALHNHTPDLVAAARAGGRDAVHKKLGELAGEIKARLLDNLNAVAVKFELTQMKELSK